LYHSHIQESLYTSSHRSLEKISIDVCTSCEQKQEQGLWTQRTRNCSCLFFVVSFKILLCIYVISAQLRSRGAECKVFTVIITCLFRHQNILCHIFSMTTRNSIVTEFCVTTLELPSKSKFSLVIMYLLQNWKNKD
jgi:hypothetical protein